MKVDYGYKLFEMDSDGNLYPLFIDRNNTIPLNEWVKAKRCNTKGFAPRPGFHLGTICDAPWLKDSTGKYKGRRKGWKRVWAECAYVSENDYNEEVSKEKKKCFVDKLPINGFYNFKETGCNRWWIICDQIKIIKILSEIERAEILNKMNYNEDVAFEPYKHAFQKRKLKEVTA